MKVLKKGSGAREWSIEKVCTGSGNGNGGCGATLLVGKSDLYRTESNHYDGSTESYVTFRCPDCRVQTDLTSAEANRVPGPLPFRSQASLREE